MVAVWKTNHTVKAEKRQQSYFCTSTSFVSWHSLAAMSSCSFFAPDFSCGFNSSSWTMTGYSTINGGRSDETHMVSECVRERDKPCMSVPACSKGSPVRSMFERLMALFNFQPRFAEQVLRRLPAPSGWTKQETTTVPRRDIVMAVLLDVALPHSKSRDEGSKREIPGPCM